MKHWWADTLFKRLFGLMWVALVVSHLCAFLAVRSFSSLPGLPARGISNLPVLPSLPPGGLLPHAGPGGPPPNFGGPRPGWEGPPPPGGPGLDAKGPPPGGGMPLDALWLDYGVRLLVIAAAAWFGARWLSAPMRHLAAASQALGQSLGTAVETRSVPTRLDEQSGTLEVRQTAKVFNTMSTQLAEQFNAQGLLMAAISHDLRTPLTRMRLRLEQLHDERQAVACIADVREMDSLIGSVLDLVRHQHGPVALQRIDVLALLQALADDLGEQGQQISVQGTPAVVMAQPAALSRVLSNLVGNALRHGGSAEVSVSITEGRARVRVEDRGPGIPAEQLDAVFKPFYRLESLGTAGPASNTGTGSAGSGLGLHIARDLVQRQGGQLLLANRPGGGLRAEVVLTLG